MVSSATSLFTRHNSPPRGPFPGSTTKNPFYFSENSVKTTSLEILSLTVRPDNIINNFYTLHRRYLSEPIVLRPLVIYTSIEKNRTNGVSVESGANGALGHDLRTGSWPKSSRRTLLSRGDQVPVHCDRSTTGLWQFSQGFPTGQGPHLRSEIRQRTG